MFFEISLSINGLQISLLIYSKSILFLEKELLICKIIIILNFYLGVGNSGIDIVTEVSQCAKNTILLARSGSWIFKVPQGEETFSREVIDRFTQNMIR